MAAQTNNMSQLDATQVLKKSYDNDAEALKVVQVNDLVISAPGDNIAISDGTNTLVINPDGSLNVAGVSPPISGAIVLTKFNSVPLIASGASTTIVSYTVPAGKKAIIQKIYMSGENWAKYTLLVDGLPINIKRTVSTNLNESFDMITGSNTGYLLLAGQVIQVDVLHNRPSAGDFDANIQYSEGT